MKLKILVLIALILLFICFLLFFGESGLSVNEVILWQIRFPKVVTCFLAGGMLASSGLLMQVYFQNPLAGPDILGVSSGSSLFVAIWILAAGALPLSIIDWGMNVMSFLGALSVFLLLVFFVQRNFSRVSLIIIGLLISSFASSGISVLVNFGQSMQLKNYMMWSMGSFRNVTFSELPRFIILSITSLIAIILSQKSLNQFLLSENYAQSMGVNVKKMRLVFISLAAWQISIVTLYCGPVGFVGILSPHLAKMILKRSQISTILLATFLIGAFLAFLAETILVIVPHWSLSINAIFGIIGAPLIVVFLYRQRSMSI